MTKCNWVSAALARRPGSGRGPASQPLHLQPSSLGRQGQPLPAALPEVSPELQLPGGWGTAGDPKQNQAKLETGNQHPDAALCPREGVFASLSCDFPSLKTRASVSILKAKQWVTVGKGQAAWVQILTLRLASGMNPARCSINLSELQFCTRRNRNDKSTDHMELWGHTRKRGACAMPSKWARSSLQPQPLSLPPFGKPRN